VARSLRAGDRGRRAVEGARDPAGGLVIRKGFHKDVDSYSAFTEADGKTTTGLAAYLKARRVKRLFVAGLARISASRGPRSMRARPASRPMCRRRLPRHRYARSLAKPGPIWPRPRQAHPVGEIAVLGSSGDRQLYPPSS